MRFDSTTFLPVGSTWVLHPLDARPVTALLNFGLTFLLWLPGVIRALLVVTRTSPTSVPTEWPYQDEEFMKKLLEHYKALEDLKRNIGSVLLVGSIVIISAALIGAVPSWMVLPSVVAVTAGWIILNSNQKEA